MKIIKLCTINCTDQKGRDEGGGGMRVGVGEDEGGGGGGMRVGEGGVWEGWGVGGIGGGGGSASLTHHTQYHRSLLLYQTAVGNKY